MIPGHLPVAGFSKNVPPDRDHNVADWQAWLFNHLEQRGGERAVSAIAVQSDITRLSRKRNQRANTALHRSQTARDCARSRPHRSGDTGGQRIIATGVKKNNVGWRLTLHIAQDEIEVDCTEIKIGRRLEPGIDWDEVIFSRNLETVTSIIEQPNVSAGQALREGFDLVPHPIVVEVDSADDLEANAL